MKKFILPAAVAISLMGCTTEETYIDEPVAAHISATIGGVPQSRVSDTEWHSGDNIGISMNGRYSNLKYSTEKGDGVFTGTTMYFKNKQEPVTISAYYPYAGSENQTAPIIEASTYTEQQTETEQSKFDFLYASAEGVTGANPNVELQFSHKMCKLTLTFENGNLGTDVSKITSCRIEGLILEGTFNSTTGLCSAKATAAKDLNLTPTVSHGVALPSLMLFPQSGGKVMLHIKDSENQEYGCELKFDGNRLESGNNYLFTIKVKKTEMVIDKFQIAGWFESTKEEEAKSE